MRIIFSILLSLCFFGQIFGQNSTEEGQGNDLFSFDLYHELMGERGNLFFSPYSIKMAFAGAMIGARGETEKEMQTVLHLSRDLNSLKLLNSRLTDFSEGKDSSQVLLGNGMWLQEGFSVRHEFEKEIEGLFKERPQIANFSQNPLQALKAINEWVSTHTRGKINHLMTAEDITSNTRLVLATSIYMKGRWTHLFETKATKKAPFFVRPNHSIQVDMMHKTAYYALYSDEFLDIIEMPYLNDSDRGPQLAMVVLFPKEGEGLHALEKELTLQKWQSWQEKMKSRQVSLAFPKFKLEERFDLNQTMSELGMILAFKSEADFSGITGTKNLYINKAAHKAFIQVDEAGTEAAAATAIGMNLTSIYQPEKPYTLNIDHPFLFFIVDKGSSTILFMGRVVQP